jgi:ribonuclease HI
VETDEDAVEARVVWSACMSYTQRDMTNNKAEYLGLIAGLQAARDNSYVANIQLEQDMAECRFKVRVEYGRRQSLHAWQEILHGMWDHFTKNGRKNEKNMATALCVGTKSPWMS